MDFNAIKKMLDSLKGKKKLMQSIQLQIKSEREQIDGLKGTDYSGTPVQGGVKEPHAQRFVEHIEFLEKRYEDIMSEVFGIEDFISKNLPNLSDIEQSIIIDRYMIGKSWRKIQQEYHYVDRQLYRIANSAIKKISSYTETCQ